MDLAPGQTTGEHDKVGADTVGEREGGRKIGGSLWNREEKKRGNVFIILLSRCGPKMFRRGIIALYSIACPSH